VTVMLLIDVKFSKDDYKSDWHCTLRKKCRIIVSLSLFVGKKIIVLSYVNRKLSLFSTC